jgi:hypothetical protein
MRRAGGVVLLAAWLVLAPATPPQAGSTEPELALADVAASVDAGAVTLELLANFDYGNFLRLGYPIEIVVTQAASTARLGLTGGVTLASGGGAPAPVPDAPGVVAIAPSRLTAVLPSDLTAGGSASVVLEATFDGATLRSNTVQVQW